MVFVEFEKFSVGNNDFVPAHKSGSLLQSTLAMTIPTFVFVFTNLLAISNHVDSKFWHSVRQL